MKRKLYRKNKSSLKNPVGTTEVGIISLPYCCMKVHYSVIHVVGGLEVRLNASGMNYRHIQVNYV